jgi:hypothetical protein
MRDLTSKRWIVAKGVLFLGLAAATGALVLMEAPSLRVAALLAILVWSSCRFYYFLFYVLQRYVDSNLRYAGLTAMLVRIWRRRGEGPP